MGKVAKLRISSPRRSEAQGGSGTWQCALVDEDGRETPITEAMIRRALARLDPRNAFPGPCPVATRTTR